MITVLVVDDDAVVRSALRIAFETAPDAEGGAAFEVHEAADGRSALDLLAGTPVDAVVLDVMMPGMDGLEVLQSIRRDGDVAIAIVMLTARGRESDVTTALRAGADAYLTKPFDLDELTEVVERIATMPLADRRLDRRRQLERAEVLMQIEQTFGDVPDGGPGHHQG
jgi:CheY-like chemotaxis protein